MARSILRHLRLTTSVVLGEIRAFGGSGRVAAGLASEGYAGGYLDALRDVEAMLTHGCPDDTRGYWRKAQEAWNRRHEPAHEALKR